jgi:hypothetical protein
MKCIKAIRATKHTEVGEIKRLNDIEANEKVSTGYWKFIPKMEWKLATRKKIAEVEAVRETYPANVEGTAEFKKANKKKRSK